MNSEIGQRIKPPEGSKWTPKLYCQAIVARAVVHIGCSVLGAYLFSRRNSTLSMKPYYFSAIATPILASLRQLYLNRFTVPVLKGIVG